MTEITRWRDQSVKPHSPGPLPEPPRSHHISKSAARPNDPLSWALEDWLDGLTIASTVDAD